MLKKLTLISCFTLAPASLFFAQTTVFGYLKNEEGKPVEQAEIDLKESDNDVTADKIGYFQLVDLMPGHYRIVISKPNYEDKVMEFDISDEKKKNLGEITFYKSLNEAEQGLTFIDADNEEGDNNQTSTVGLLQSSRDVFSRIAAYDLGAYWFRPRGVDGRGGEIMMNGTSMIKADRGFVDFGNWGGLNEITKYPEIAANHSPSEYAFGDVSGVVYKNTKPSENRKGLQFTYSLTNRNYRNRLSLRYTSGMSKKGWAFTAMAARRWAEEGIQEGTFYDAYGTYLGVEKKFNDKHTMTFNFIGSPYRRSTSSPSTQEVYDLRGVHYNAYWGYQNGEKRSERVKNSFQPIFQLQDFWKINNKTKLWTNVSYQFGKYKASRLDWYNATNPSPIYWRNLPSYFNYYDNDAIVDFGGSPTLAQQAYQTTLNAWKDNDTKFTQIDWDALYRKNIVQPINTQYGGKRAIYYLVNDVSDDKIWNVGTHLTHDFSDASKFILNLSYQNYFSEQYREVKDLLGADFALNKDDFASSNQLGASGLLNERGNTIAKEGDKIDYNYQFRRQEVTVNPAYKFSTGKFDAFVSGMFKYSSSNREGIFDHYLYQDSFGKSTNQEFYDFGLKGQLVYRLNGRNFLVYNGGAFSKAPYLSNIFINARSNATVTPNLKSTMYYANDLSYVISSPFVKLRLTGYLINSQNETGVQRFYADGIEFEKTDSEGNTTEVSRAFITQVMSNVEKRNIGAELGIEYKLTSSLSLQGLATYGRYTYRNNPDLYFASDAIGTFVENGEKKSFGNLGKSYIKGYKQGGSPQQAYSFGFRYNSPKYWWIGANWNYLTDNYLDPSALLRNTSFVKSTLTGTPYADITVKDLKNVLEQKKLPSAHFFNVNLGKSWMIGKYYVLITATVNNIFDNTDYITGGFEQTRNAKYENFKKDLDRTFPMFGPKYWYTQGRSYFINLQVRFK